MKKLNLVCLFSCFLILSACGGSGSDLSSKNDSTSSSLSSSAGSSSSSLSSNPSVDTQKKLDVKFASNGCLESSNADAFTDFDFAGSSRRMLSWSCVIGVEESFVSTGLDLFYSYDTVFGCYKQIQNDTSLIKGALYNQTYFPDCSVSAKSVSQPSYALEIVDLKIIALSRSSEPKLGFSFAYELKNVGTLPVTQYRISLKESIYPSGVYLGSTGSYASDSRLPPGKTVVVKDSTFYSSSYKLGDLIEFTFIVTDYYGNNLASMVKRVAVE